MQVRKSYFLGKSNGLNRRLGGELCDRKGNDGNGIKRGTYYFNEIIFLKLL